jgi:hypothetical protein
MNDRRLSPAEEWLAQPEWEWEEEETVAVAADANPLDFLCAIFPDPRQPMSRRMRAAIEATPYFHPKLSATALVPMGEGFARRLEQAIERAGPRSSSTPDLEPRYRRMAHRVATGNLRQSLTRRPTRQRLLTLMCRELQLAAKSDPSRHRPLPPLIGPGPD